MNIFPAFSIGVSVAWYAIYSIQLLRIKNSSRLQRLLAIIFILWGITTLKDLVFFIPGADFEVFQRHALYIDGCGALTLALLLMEVTMPGWITRKRVLLLSLPFVLFLLVYNFVHLQWFDSVFKTFCIVYALAAEVIAIFKGRKYARDIRNTYSDLTGVDISWMWNIIFLFVVIELIWWNVSAIDNTLYVTLYYFGILLCWHLAMVSINHMSATRLLYTIEQPEVEPTASQAKYTAALSGRLESLMDERQLYLNPDLTLADLVKALGTNRTYLSDYISGTLHTTFYDYVNQLRIERKAIPMIESTSMNYTFEYIAEQSGFKSITTFRRAFKNFTGMLPSEYRQQHMN